MYNTLCPLLPIITDTECLDLMYMQPTTEILFGEPTLEKFYEKKSKQLNEYFRKSSKPDADPGLWVEVFPSMKFGSTTYHSTKYRANTKHCFVSADFQSGQRLKTYYGKVLFFFKCQVQQEQYELAFCEWYPTIDKQECAPLIVVDTSTPYKVDSVVQLNQIKNKIALVPYSTISSSQDTSLHFVVDVYAAFVDDNESWFIAVAGNYIVGRRIGLESTW